MVADAIPDSNNYRATESNPGWFQKQKCVGGGGGGGGGGGEGGGRCWSTRAKQQERDPRGIFINLDALREHLL